MEASVHENATKTNSEGFRCSSSTASLGQQRDRDVHERPVDHGGRILGSEKSNAGEGSNSDVHRSRASAITGVDSDESRILGERNTHVPGSKVRITGTVSRPKIKDTDVSPALLVDDRERPEQTQSPGIEMSSPSAQGQYELDVLAAAPNHSPQQVSQRSPSSTGNASQALAPPSTGAGQHQVSSNKGDLMQIYWLRTVTCISVPALIAIYYAFIVTFWLQSYQENAAIDHGRRGGAWAYYSWFLAGVFGLGLSTYSLAGVEAGMLMERRWKADNANQLIIHCDKTWGSPVGWVNITINHIRGYRQRPTRTWLLLASISLIPYVALPLSGFTMQLTTGYEHGNPGTERAPLNGQNATTFGIQVAETALLRTLDRWKLHLPSQLSGHSAYYVPELSFDRQNEPWLQTFPNEWPDYESSNVFIAPQSDKPVNGEAWGLQAVFNCTTVSSVEQFHLLSQRTTDGSQPRCPAIRVGAWNYNHPQYGTLPELCDYDAYVQGQPARYRYITYDADLVDGSMEIAVKSVRRTNPRGGATPFNEPKPILFEAALWQAPIELNSPCAEMERHISNTLNITVASMNKTYNKDWDMHGSPISPKRITMEAVGVQCESSFKGGTATLDGLKGTYASFTAKEPVPINSATLVPLATALPKIVRGELAGGLELIEMNNFQALEDVIKNNPLYRKNSGDIDLIPEIASNASWLLNIYKSVNAYNIFPWTCDERGIPVGPDKRAYDGQQLQLVTSEQFKQSIIGAHKAYAIELMKSPNAKWHGNLTYAIETSILSPGQISPISVLILLILWAVCSTTLGILFGLRPRWADTLDGFSMFRFGSDNPGFADGCCVKTYDQCPDLLLIPGLVGDSRPDEQVGHISLVQSPPAEKTKSYRGS